MWRVGWGGKHLICKYTYIYYGALSGLSELNPEKLKSMNIKATQIIDALEMNNSVAGGGYIEKSNESFFVRGEGMIKSIEDIENIVIKNVDGIPILIKDVAEVNFGFANRFGAITGNGEGEKVLGQVMMLKQMPLQSNFWKTIHYKEVMTII